MTVTTDPTRDRIRRHLRVDAIAITALREKLYAMDSADYQAIEDRAIEIITNAGITKLSRYAIQSALTTAVQEHEGDTT